MNRYSAQVARGVLAAAALLDPEVVVLGGGIGSNPYLLGPIRSEVQRISPFPVAVEVSRLGPRAGVVGAIADARRSALGKLISVPEQFSTMELEEVFAGWGRRAQGAASA